MLNDDISIPWERPLIGSSTASFCLGRVTFLRSSRRACLSFCSFGVMSRRVRIRVGRGCTIATLWSGRAVGYCWKRAVYRSRGVAGIWSGITIWGYPWWWWCRWIGVGTRWGWTMGTDHQLRHHSFIAQSWVIRLRCRHNEGIHSRIIPRAEYPWECVLTIFNAPRSSRLPPYTQNKEYCSCYHDNASKCDADCDTNRPLFIRWGVIIERDLARISYSWHETRTGVIWRADCIDQGSGVPPLASRIGDGSYRYF